MTLISHTEPTLFPDYEQNHFADYCRILRGPYSHRELADILGTSHGLITQWESGQCVPRPETLRKLIAHYQQWAITDGLGDAADRANKALAQKIRLTRHKRRVKTPETYPTLET